MVPNDLICMPRWACDLAEKRTCAVARSLRAPPVYASDRLPSEHPDAQCVGSGTDGDEGEPDRVPGREDNYGEDHRTEEHRVQNGHGPDGALV